MKTAKLYQLIKERINSRRRIEMLHQTSDKLNMVRWWFARLIFALSAVLVMSGCTDSKNVVSGFINDTFNRSTLAVDSLSASMVEGSSNTFVLILDRGVKADSELNWEIDAPAGVFATQSGTIQFAAGERTKALQITSLQNSITEGDRHFALTLSGSSSVFANSLVIDLEVIDDDTEPTLTIADVSVTEGTGAGTTEAVFSVTLNHLSTTPVVVNYATANGNAIAGTDYTSTSGTLTIPAGSLIGYIAVPITRDAINETNETFTITLSGGSGYTAAGSRLSATGTIEDDESQFSISIADASIAEGNSGTSNLVFRVTMAGVSAQNVTFDVATANVTATAGSDYTMTSQTNVTILAGNTFVDVSVPVSGDTLYEANETFKVVISGGAGYLSSSSDLEAIGTITNDDTSPSISIANRSLTEGDSGTSNMTFTVAASSASGLPITVNYSTSDGTAVAGSDYTTASGSVTIPAGSTTATFDVTILGDTVYEANETFNVTLSGGTGYNSGASTLSATGTITNDDDAPSISIGNRSVTEGNSGTSNMTFTVTLSAVTQVPVVVNYATSNGSASAGSDYTAESNSITIPAGSTTGSFDISVTGDTLYETNETFTLTLSGGSGYDAANSTLVATGTITNDDTAPSISIASRTMNEGNSGTANMTFTITASAVSGVPITVNYATSGGTATSGDDYNGVTGLATIAAGSTTTTFNVGILGDTIYENDETFNVTLSGGADYNSGASTLSAVGTITNDDTAPTLSISDVSIAEGNSGSANLNFTATLSTASAVAVTVNYATANGTATAGSDYEAKTGSITLAAGETSKTISIPVYGDTVYEANETFTVTLSGGSNYTAGTLVATGTINNDDSAPSISIANVSVNEGTGAGTTNATFTITASVASGLPITATFATSNSTAISGTDYTGVSQTITIAAGNLTTTIDVPITRDATYESNKTFNVALSGGSGYDAATSTLTATGTIIDDDFLTQTWNLASSSVTLTDYVYDPDLINFVSGTGAILKVIDTTADTTTEWNRGKHFGTYSSGNTLQLSTSAPRRSLASSWTPEYSSLAGYWKFDNDYVDAITAATATASASPTFSTEAQVGTHSLQFSGNSNYVTIANQASYNSEYEQTIMFWMYSDAATLDDTAGIDDRVLLTKGSASQWNFILDQTGGVSAGFYAPVSLTRLSASAATTAASLYQKWNHIAATFNSNKGIVTIYVNGAKSGTTNFTPGQKINVTSSAITVNEVGQSNERFPGKIDALAIFTKALTAEQIGSIYNTQSSNYPVSLASDWMPKPSNLVGYWKFDGDWSDASSKGNTLSPGSNISLSPSGKVGSGAMSASATGYSATGPNLSELNGVNRFTISGWFRFSAFTNGAVLWSKGSGNTKIHLQTGTTGMCSSNRALSVSVNNSDSSYTCTPTILETNSWTHITVVFDGTLSSSVRLKLYLNGILVSTYISGTTPDTAPTTSNGFSIGGQNGLTDEVSIWSTALSANEAWNLYSQSSAVYLGRYESPVVDLGNSSTPWTSLTPVTPAPYLKELANSSESNAVGLMTDVSGIWHFNETTMVGLPAANDFADSTNSMYFARTTGTLSPGYNTLFSRGIMSVSGVLVGPLPQTLVPTNSTGITVSIWVQPFDMVTDRRVISFPKSDSATAFGIAAGRVTSKFSLFGLNSSGTLVEAATTNTFSSGRIYHLVLTINSTEAVLYVNGRREITSTGINLAQTLQTSTTRQIRLGGSPGDTGEFYGTFDELAVWKRAITQTEVRSLYQRGITQTRYQVRSCANNPCLSSEPFIGPDGTSSTYYSELVNNTSIDGGGYPTGSVKSTAPSFDWSSGTIFPVSARPASARYFQYRAVMSTQDIDQGCVDGSNNPTTCLPSITSIAVGPTGRTYMGYTPVSNRAPASMSSIASFTATDSSTCTRYQLSTDGGVTWKYWTGSAFANATVTTDDTQMNTKAALAAANFSLLGTGAKDVSFRTFLKAASFGDTCSVGSVDMTYR